MKNIRENTKETTKFLISSVVIFTFLISLFILSYVELYSVKSTEVTNVPWKEFCLNLIQPPGGIGFYMFIYDKLFPFGFLMILISVIIVLAMYFFIFLKTFVYDKNMSLKFAIFTVLVIFLPLSSLFIFSVPIITPLLVLVLVILVFAQLKISLVYNKYKLVFFTILVFLSYFLLFGAWIDTKHSVFYNCYRFLH